MSLKRICEYFEVGFKTNRRHPDQLSCVITKQAVFCRAHDHVHNKKCLLATVWRTFESCQSVLRCTLFQNMTSSSVIKPYVA